MDDHELANLHNELRDTAIKYAHTEQLRERLIRVIAPLEKSQSGKIKQLPTKADGIPVHCLFDKIVDIDLLKPNPRNPNKHPETQIDLLAKIIKYQGWRRVITISKRSGFIVTGHGRLLAAQKLGVKQVPIAYQKYKTEADEWADMVADNKIAEKADTDGLLMAELLSELDMLNFDLDLTGLTLAEIEDYITGPTVEKKSLPEEDYDYMSFVVTAEQRQEIEVKLDSQDGENRTEQLLCLIRKK